MLKYRNYESYRKVPAISRRVRPLDPSTRKHVRGVTESLFRYSLYVPTCLPYKFSTEFPIPTRLISHSKQRNNDSILYAIKVYI